MFFLKNNHNRKLYVGFFSLFLLCSGCMKVSQQSVVLSSVVTQRISAMQASHEAFVTSYFRATSERIEDFISHRWIPVFLENFVAKADSHGHGLDEVLEEATPFTPEQETRLKASLLSAGVTNPEPVLKALRHALGGAERGEIVLQFAEAAASEIMRKRKSLLNPIKELERKTLQELRLSYAQIQEAQSAVVGHLRSLKSVQDEQDKVLQKVGLLEKRDRVVEKAIDVNESITSILDSGETAKTTLEAFKNKIDGLRKIESSHTDNE